METYTLNVFIFYQRWTTVMVR